MNAEANKYFATETQLRMAHAIEHGDSKTIRDLIVKRLVKPDEYGLVHQPQQSDERPVSFLTYAVMVASKPSIEALISSRADVNFRTPGGWSALAEAATCSDETLLPFLLSKGGDVNGRGSANRPIAMWAYMSGHLPRMNLLLDRGADVNAEDSTQTTLLETMADLNDYKNMLGLLARGADPTIADNEQHTTVGWAVQSSAGRLTPEAEQLRQQVIKVLESKGIHFPVPAPPVWDTRQRKYVPR